MLWPSQALRVQVLRYRGQWRQGEGGGLGEVQSAGAPTGDGPSRVYSLEPFTVLVTPGPAIAVTVQCRLSPSAPQTLCFKVLRGKVHSGLLCAPADLRRSDISP